MTKQISSISSASSLARLRILLRGIPKKHYIESIVVIFILGVILWATTLLTPYQPKPQLSFYSSDDTRATSATYHRATIIAIEDSSLKVKPLDGDISKDEVSVPYNKSSRNSVLKNGDTILVIANTSTDTLNYIDRYRIPGLVIIIALFITLVVVVGRRRGISSLVGLGVSIAVVGWFVVPLIIAGHNALLISVIGAYLIAFSSIIIAHGRKPRTFISIACVSIILLVVAVASQIAVTLLGLSGLSDESSSYLSVAKPQIDLAGVTVDELQKANHSLTVKELYARASSVGGEHIASLVNTLALVYAGAALPIIISLTSYSNNLMLLFNGEYLATEIVRTIIASSGLVLAVPVSTIIAANILHKRHASRHRRLAS
ncbi:YibE/F family protein [Candidatus Saccharibacteria bacterium]|nr:YibE/F family protein [Candidatus Saccharibacteria bacterium]